MSWYFVYLGTWGVTAAVTSLFVWLAIYFAPKWGFLDIPLHEAHKRHLHPMPVMGGFGMLLGWLVTLILGILVLTRNPRLPKEIQAVLPGIPYAGAQLLQVILGAMTACLLGMCDDRRPMHALPKFLVQGLIALMLALAGMKITFLSAIPGANLVATVFWILLVMNALNFFDNMDGLAAGAAMIAAAVFLFTAALRGQFFVATLAALTGGAATGFYFFNYPPAKIFMGDGGSHFLGVLLAVCGILTSYYIPGETPTAAPRLIPFCALGVPLFDVVAVVLIRLRLRVPIYKGDNRHISHRFANLGLSRPQAVVLVHLLGLVVGLAGLTLLWLPPLGVILVLLLLAVVFALISLLQYEVPNERKIKS